MQTKHCYTIWFTQRTGSTLLCEALRSTGVAGRPGEWLHGADYKALTRDNVSSMLRDGTTENGLFGIKINYESELMAHFRQLYDVPEQATRAEVWSAAFPNCNKHIYMTRRNKVRLAVSWWRAIVSGEWHRKHGEKPQEHQIADQYNFEAINHLIAEADLREASLEDFFTEASIAPLTIVYEDFILNYEHTVKHILEYLDVPTEGISIAPPYFDRLADEVAEQWVQRYRQEKQQGWDRVAW